MFSFLGSIYGRFWVFFVSGFSSFWIFVFRLVFGFSRFSDQLVHWAVLGWGKGIFWGFPWVKIKIEGQEHLSSEKCIYAANHVSQLDVPLLALLPGYKVWFTKGSLFWIPVFGQGLWGMRSVPVSRSRKKSAKSIDYLTHAKQRLDKGYSIVMYVEGTRSRTGVLLPFKKGFARLSHAFQVPVQPCVIKGAFEVNPAGAGLIKKGVITLQILPQIYPKDFENEEKMVQFLQKKFQNLLSLEKH
jgi:1-acyl-sn-glycerol-3-phosphate acyltransferase